MKLITSLLILSSVLSLSAQAVRRNVISTNTTTEVTNVVKAIASTVATNTAVLTITTNDFTIDTFYTNSAQRSWVGVSINMTNVLATEKSQVALYIDQDADGTFEYQGLQVSLQGVALLAGTEELCAFLQPSARFVFTNLGTAANASIRPNSSQWIRQ